MLPCGCGILKPAGDQPSDLAGRAKQRQRLAQEFLVCGSVVDLVFSVQSGDFAGARIHFTSLGAGAGGVRAGSSFIASHNDMATFPTASKMLQSNKIARKFGATVGYPNPRKEHDLRRSARQNYNGNPIRF